MNKDVLLCRRNVYEKYFGHLQEL